MRKLAMVLIGGGLAFACRTPSPVLHDEGGGTRSFDSAPLDWRTPVAGRSHTLMPTPKTVAWGWYDAEGEPVLRVASGDEITVRALSTCNPTSLRNAGLDTNRIEQLAKDIYAARSTMRTGPGGHILTGPIYIEGADSGDVLEVRFKSIKPAIDYGCNSFGPTSGFLPEDFPNTRRSKIIELDTVRMLGKFSDDITIPLKPFFGSVGVAPPKAMGRIHSAPPTIHAGNLDNKELVAGTTLYIPVWTKGALLEMGDGHAAQGNGEVDITAIETSLIGRVQVIVRKDMKLSWPRGETPTHYIAMGTDSALVKATKTAVRQGIELLVDVKKMTREDAYQLLSVAGDVAITQLVDGTVGVHVMIPKAIFTGQKR
jgi:acetamidase/formamidase